MANILITGANQGIGYYMVAQFLKDGNRVSVLDRELDNLADLKTLYPTELLCFQADVRDEAAMQEAVNSTVSIFGTIDIAIHNACKCTFEMEADTHIDIYRDVFEVNYYGALRLAKSVLPYMVKQGNGRIIFTSSGVGVTGFMGVSPYASSKGAIESLAKCLRIEYKKRNISFHIIHPPLTQTKSSAPLPVPKEFMAKPEIVGHGLAKRILSKRFIICHSLSQKFQTMGCYFFPLKMGGLLSDLTANCKKEIEGPLH